LGYLGQQSARLFKRIPIANFSSLSFCDLTGTMGLFNRKKEKKDAAENTVGPELLKVTSTLHQLTAVPESLCN
jgi:hypothetical protein